MAGELFARASFTAFFDGNFRNRYRQDEKLADKLVHDTSIKRGNKNNF